LLEARIKGFRAYTDVVSRVDAPTTPRKPRKAKAQPEDAV
jgi:hypothetical protein